MVVYALAYIASTVGVDPARQPRPAPCLLDYSKAFSHTALVTR